MMTVMKRRVHYESGKQSLNDTAENSSDLKLADKIARRLSWLWGWQQALELSYAQSALKSLVNGWLGIPTVPAMAYVYVEDITYWSRMGK